MFDRACQDEWPPISACLGGCGAANGLRCSMQARAPRHLSRAALNGSAAAPDPNYIRLHPEALRIRVLASMANCSGSLQKVATSGVGYE